MTIHLRKPWAVLAGAGLALSSRSAAGRPISGDAAPYAPAAKQQPSPANPEPAPVQPQRLAAPTYPIDLPTALRLADANNPTVGGRPRPGAGSGRQSRPRPGAVGSDPLDRADFLLPRRHRPEPPRRHLHRRARELHARRRADAASRSVRRALSAAGRPPGCPGRELAGARDHQQHPARSRAGIPRSGGTARR